MAGQAKDRTVLVFWRDEAGNGRVVGIVAGEAGDGRGILAQGDVGARHRVSLDGMIEFVSLVEVKIDPGIHFLEGDCGAPGESESVRLAIHLHKTADVASHTDVLRRSVQMAREVTGVWRVAEDAVALLVRRMLDRVSGQGVATKAELSGGRGKSDVGGALNIGDRVANGATHGDRGMNILPCGLVFVTLETFGGIDLGGQKDRMLVKVGTQRRSGKQQDEGSQECGENNQTVAHGRKWHKSPFAESEDFAYPAERG